MNASDGLDERYVAAFDVVRSSARVDILLALADRTSAAPDDPALAFSALHDAVDIDDSGQFNYHLGKLRDHLAVSGEDGYRLFLRGHEVAGAILSGAFAAGDDRGPERLDGSLPTAIRRSTPCTRAVRSQYPANAGTRSLPKFASVVSVPIWD